MPKVSKDRAQQALWYRGVLDWKLHEGQMVIEEAYGRKAAKKLFVGNCARRFGKSFWLVKQAIETVLTCKNPNPVIFIASATLIDLERFILSAFKTILHDCPVDIWPGWEEGYVRSKKKFIGFCPSGDSPNGAEIHLVGLDANPDGIRGNYADLVILDEAGTINDLKYLFSSVIGPMTLTRPGSRILMLSTPPVTPAHDFKYFCDLAKERKAYVELDIYQNPMMTPELIEQAREDCLTETDWKREYMCQFIVDETRAICPEWTKEHIVDIPRPEDFRYFDRYVGMDLGTKIDFTAVLYGYWNSTERYVYIESEDDIMGPKMTTPDLYKMIVAKEAELWPNMGDPYRRVADNNNPLLLQDLGYIHGLYFSATTKDELHAMVNDLRRMIKENRVRVHPRCKKLIGCMFSAVWDKERKKFDRSSQYGHFDHLAALMYLVRNLDQSRDNIPLHREAQKYDEFRRERKEETQVMKTVAKMLGFNRKS